MTTHQIYLGLGSNLGDRQANLAAAIAGLGAAVKITAVSPLYETEPWGLKKQPNFLNMCARGETALEPQALLAFVKQLETDLGREPAEHWGPRLIDIDILFYDDLILSIPHLTIPHPGASDRATVLIPLEDIAPALVHPQIGQTIAWLAAHADTTGIRPFPPPNESD
jgi:2-amino-4-hydroxy-6-hydroxymethyldihydropteridine diphosphokinase